MILIDALMHDDEKKRFTVWTFQDFSVAQILRHDKVGESRSTKTAIFAILEALNCVDLVNFSLQKVKKS